MSVGCRRDSESGGGSSEVACGGVWFRHGTMIKQLMVLRGGVARICSGSHPVFYSDVNSAKVTLNCQNISQIGEKYHPNRRPFRT